MSRSCWCMVCFISQGVILQCTVHTVCIPDPWGACSWRPSCSEICADTSSLLRPPTDRIWESKCRGLRYCWHSDPAHVSANTERAKKYETWTSSRLFHRPYICWGIKQRAWSRHLVLVSSSVTSSNSARFVSLVNHAKELKLTWCAAGLPALLSAVKEPQCFSLRSQRKSSFQKELQTSAWQQWKEFSNCQCGFTDQLQQKIHLINFLSEYICKKALLACLILCIIKDTDFQLGLLYN